MNKKQSDPTWDEFTNNLDEVIKSIDNIDNFLKSINFRQLPYDKTNYRVDKRFVPSESCNNCIYNSKHIATNSVDDMSAIFSSGICSKHNIDLITIRDIYNDGTCLRWDGYNICDNYIHTNLKPIITHICGYCNTKMYLIDEKIWGCLTIGCKNYENWYR